MSDYEKFHYDKELLKQSATAFGSIEVNPVSDLEGIRFMINKLSEDSGENTKVTTDWCFIDCKHVFFFLERTIP